MKKVFYFLKSIIIVALFRITNSQLCSYQQNECEICTISKKNFVSILCSTENRTDSQLLSKININSQSFYQIYSKYDQISIQKKNLRTLPSLLLKNIDIITLSLVGNQIEYILNDTFSGIKSLIYLILSENNIKSIDNLIISFTANIYINKQGLFETLKQIDLYDNQIEVISVPFTTAFGNLLKLFVNRNKIDVISNDAFVNTKNLTLLYLNQNLT
jgi:hypothetical protein